MGRSRKPAGALKQGRASTRLDRGHLGRGMAAALLLHIHILVPLLVATFIYAGRESAQRAEEVDVGFEDVPAEQLPRDIPPLDETPAPVAKLSRERTKPERRDRAHDRKKRQKVQRKPEEKVAKAPSPPPEPQVVVPPLPPVPKPEAPEVPAQLKEHEKIVNLDNPKDVEPPPDAKYLAQKNNRATVETRARDTNLEREQKGGEGSQAPQNERRDDKQVGDDKARIADLQDQKSKAGRSAPQVTPTKQPEAPQPPDEKSPRRPSPVLTLRDAAPRGHDLTPETVDPSLPRDPTGLVAAPKPRSAFRDDAGEHVSRGKRMKLLLSGKDYEYLFGSEAKAERQLAQKERSARLGKRARRLAQIHSALENFIPEVTAGNQTALNTRAAPFAAFIDQVHRTIHRLWGAGALDDWDELPSSSPFSDDSLVTTLEIVLNRDGSIDKVAMVRPSRYLAFDAAAIDAVLSAGPYPEPPREIRSGNGKVYFHWNFHRDARQCATSGVDYFILNNAPKGGDLGDSGDQPTVPAVPQSEFEPSRAGALSEPRSAPRRLERNLGDGPVGRGGGRRVVAEAVPESIGEAAGPTQSLGVSRPADTGAVELARAWFAALARGDIHAMTARAGFPFRSAAGVVAQNAGDLSRMLSGLVSETPSRTSGPVSVETSAGLRKRIGKLPPGLDDGSGLLFAVSHSDGDTLILLLSRSGPGSGDIQNWKAVGLIRR